MSYGPGGVELTERDRNPYFVRCPGIDLTPNSRKLPVHPEYKGKETPKSESPVKEEVRTTEDPIVYGGL